MIYKCAYNKCEKKLPKGEIPASIIINKQLIGFCSMSCKDIAMGKKEEKKKDGDSN